MKQAICTNYFVWHFSESKSVEDNRIYTAHLNSVWKQQEMHIDVIEDVTIWKCFENNYFNLRHCGDLKKQENDSSPPEGFWGLENTLK